VDLPRERIPVRTSLVWLAFPLLYLVYSLVRGPIVEWYPYPFLDPRSAGYGTVAVMSVLIAVAAFAFAVVAALSTKLQNSVPHPALISPPETAGEPRITARGRHAGDDAGLEGQQGR